MVMKSLRKQCHEQWKNGNLKEIHYSGYEKKDNKNHREILIVDTYADSWHTFISRRIWDMTEVIFFYTEHCNEGDRPPSYKV